MAKLSTRQHDFISVQARMTNGKLASATDEFHIYAFDNPEHANIFNHQLRTYGYQTEMRMGKRSSFTYVKAYRLN